MLLPPTRGPHPAVVYLYGSLGLSKVITDHRYFRDAVVRRGYALIVPAALDTIYRDGDKGTGWGRRARAGRHPRNDLDFLRRVIEDARLRHNIDPRRVLFAGQSDGGALIWEIACHNPEMGAAFAVHAGGYGGPLPKTCRKPVRFLHAHGTADTVVPMTGLVHGGRWVELAPLAGSLALLAATNGCRPEAAAAERFRGFERRRWEGCRPGSALDLLTHPGGHDWPATWLPAVLDWFEQTADQPAEAVTRRVGEGPSPARRVGDAPPVTRFQSPGGAGGRFLRAPK